MKNDKELALAMLAGAKALKLYIRIKSDISFVLKPFGRNKRLEISYHHASDVLQKVGMATLEAYIKNEGAKHE